MKRRPFIHALLGATSFAVLACASPGAQAAGQTVLTVFAAGTLAVPFREIDQAFEKQHPGVEVQAQFGGSVKMVKRITELHQNCDVYASADYSVVPKYLFGENGAKRYADWYAGLVSNAITFVYTDKSKYAREINDRNWYEVLAKPGVEIGRSDPDTDPSGYQTVQMLNLADRYYKDPKIEQRILANAPRSNMRDTETSLISALQLGQIDYLAIYRSDALQHHLRHLKLPAKIDLSDPRDAAFYKTGVAHTKNGTLTGKPIVYALTVPLNAAHKDLADEYAAFVLGPEGRKILARHGFGTFATPPAVGRDKMPPMLQKLVKPWQGEG
ncbi:MAG: tungstate ABC transporter substrate-binding protein WtpA [Betaproteobacteria bacterium]|nr:tungstate ABC transporter substrate-binding protein WtpA [Betaproteobacteria bacterium]